MQYVLQICCLEVNMKQEWQKKKKTVWMKMELFPVIFILTVLPLIVRLKIVKTGLENYTWFPEQSIRGDFFAWWRSVIFLMLSVWMIFILLYRKVVLKYQWKIKKEWMLLLAYMALTVISSVFSKFQNISWFGMVENYEGCFVILAYGIAFFYTVQIVETKRQIQILLEAFSFGALLQAALGLTQFTGKDFWSSFIGNLLIAPGEKLSFQFTDSKTNTVYMALYNPNYAAVFIVMVLPVCIYLFCTYKEIWKKTIISIEIFMLLICLRGTGSKASVVALAAVLGIWSCKVLISKKGKWGIVAGVCILAVAAAIMVRICPVLKSSYNLQDILVTDSGFEVKTSNGEFFVTAKAYGKDSVLLLVKDENGEKLPVEYNEKRGRSVIKRKKYRAFSFEWYMKNESIYVVMYYKKHPFYFVKEGDGAFTYQNIFGKKDSIEKAETYITDAYDRVLNSRIYIWNRVLPLIKHYIIKGSGPDTFAFVFPQNDYVGRINASTAVYEDIITKPHSMYLQTALQNGVLSLGCLIAFFFCCLRKMIKRNERFYIALAISIVGYLIMGIVNDSMIMTAPVFWVLLGIGMALV